MLDSALTNTCFIAFASAVLGALIPVFLSPCFKEFYNKRRELAYIKRNLNCYLSYHRTQVSLRFVYSYTCSLGKENFHLSVKYSDLEELLSNRRFNKSVMLKERDYKNILDYCYKRDISHFELSKHEKIYTDLFLKKKYDIV